MIVAQSVMESPFSTYTNVIGGGVGFPPKYVPLEVVFIVILWKCSKNPQCQSVAAVASEETGWARHLTLFP